MAYIKDGEEAKVVGTIVPMEELLVAPLSQRNCVHYFVEVEHHRSNGKNSKWDTIIQEEITSKFLIQDEDRYALVYGERVRSNITIDKNYTSGTFNDATEVLEDYLQAHGHESEGLLGFNKTMRYKEGVLEANEAISVFGVANWKTGKELGLPKKFDKVLVITAAINDYVYLSDDTETTTEIRKGSWALPPQKG